MQENQQDFHFEDTIDFKALVVIVRRWAWALILGLVLGALVGYLISLYQVPVYQASTTVMITRAPQDKSLDLNYSNSQQLTATYIRLLTTRPMIESASERLNLKINPDEISVSQLRDTQVIEIKIDNTNPEQAKAIANTLADVLIEQNETLLSGRYQATENNMQTQLDQVQSQIERLNSDIDTLSQRSIQDQIDQVQAQITPLQDETTKLEQEISVLDVPNASIENKALIIEKKNRMAQIQPVLLLYRQVYSNLLVLGKSANSGTQNDTQLAQLQTTLGLYQQIYFNLLNNLETIRLSRLENTPSVAQIEPAILPIEPIRPRPLIYSLLGGLAAFVLASITIFLIEYFDDTFKTPEDVERVLGLTVLGYVAQVTDAEIKLGNLNVSIQPRSPIAEAFRSLRANLEFSGLNRPLRTIMITSAIPGEGKSTVAANLAMTMAQGGKHVTLLDADLRRPSAHRFFKLPNRVGLTDVFRGRVELADIRQTIEGDNNITVITSGSLPPNPTELLASEKMDVILENLKISEDIIILDSAPTVVADAQFLAAKVDGVLLIIQPGKTHEDELRATVEQLKRAGAHVLGAVFNRIPQNRSSYYGGYKQYSPYHYRTYQYNSHPIAATESVEINKK